ncbi:DUF305 domain-containing protein [Lentzea sp. NPDC058436]|uniref:DUF305 domain-containing protein n=1 Tax=Lentzea sp. NPDC058436 TaxID=3346499 RepID=UPI00365EA3D1
MPWGVSALVLLAACAAPAPPPPQQQVSPFNATDTAWVQLMIPMNEQLLPALEAAPPALAGFAADLKASHESELVHLRQLRDRAGLPDTNLHAGHQMPGLVSEADLLVIRADPSALSKKLHEHLDQTAKLARSELENGTDAATKEFAASVESSRKDQLTRLGQG